jgi:CRP/FNR family transcriptional regulator, cyclic AMP receptor protein
MNSSDLDTEPLRMQAQPIDGVPGATLAQWFLHRRKRIVSSELEESINKFPPAMATLARQGHVQRYKKGIVLITEGEHGDNLYVVLQGSVKSYSTDGEGHEVVYSTSGPGEYFGEMSLDGGPRSASVMTLAPTVCAVITRQELEAHLLSEPAFALQMMTQIIARARLATQAARSMALYDIYGRMIRYFETLGEVQADGSRLLPEKLTQQDIANRVGSSREMISRILRDLETGGYISVVHRRITILKKLPAKW